MSTAPRVTIEQMQERIDEVEYFNLKGTLTICIITLNNGFMVRGESACVSPENYHKETGEGIAYKNAFNQLWPLFGFLLAEDLYRGKDAA